MDPVSLGIAGAVGIGGSFFKKKTKSPDASLRGSLKDIFGAFTPEQIAYLGKFTGMGYQQDLKLSKEFGSQFQAERMRLMEEDPLIKRLRGVAIGGLKGLQGGALPADIQRSILDRTRQAQLARGIEDSSMAASQEAAALTGGAEMFRQSRINQALAVGNQYAAPGQMLGSGMPSFGSLLGAQQNMLGLRQNQAQLATQENPWNQAIGSLQGLAGGVLGNAIGSYG